MTTPEQQFEESTEAYKNVMETPEKLAGLKRIDKDICDADFWKNVETIMC